MPETLITPFSRWILAGVALIGACALSVDASAQMNPPAPVPPQGVPGAAPGAAPVNPMCPRLEAQLATIDRGGSRPGQGRSDPPLPGCRDQAAGRARPGHVAGQAHGLRQFRVFLAVLRPVGAMRSGQQPDPADAGQSGPDHLQPGAAAQRRPRRRRSRKPAPLGPDRRWRRTIAARNTPMPLRGSGNFLDNLFGNNNNYNNPSAPSADLGPQSGTFRTVCVRSCDGAYFPISFATVPARFPDDEKTCKALCPAADATLFAYRNPGEDMNQAVSISGQPYTVVAERIPLPPGVQSVLLLQGRRTDLVRRAEEHRRQGRRRTAGRHHRHRGQREEDGAALAGEGSRDDREEGRRRHHRYRARRFAAGRFQHLPHQPAGRETRSAPSARPSSRRARDPIPRTLQPTRSRARDSSVSSGLGSGLPASRKRLVMG